MSVCSSNPERGKRFLTFSECQDHLKGPLSLLFNGNGVLSGVKWPGCDVDHSPPSNAEVKNEWSYTSAHHICLHGVDRKSLPLLDKRQC